MDIPAIKAILFDLGQVLARIDQNRTMTGLCSFLDRDRIAPRALDAFSKTIFRYETGQIGTDGFLTALDRFLHEQNPSLPAGYPSETTLKDLWNAMVVSLPEENLHLLERIKPHYDLFLLSNTNALHMEYIERLLPQGSPGFHSYFKRVFCSYELHLHKPDPEIYREACRQAGIRPEESLFIDDRQENIEAARKTGLEAFLLHDFQVGKLFDAQGFLDPEAFRQR